MRDMRIGVYGRITHGDGAGRYVRVIDDAENTGGYLIFTSADMPARTEVFDSWVETIIDVDLYADESDWEIDWQPTRIE